MIRNRCYGGDPAEVAAIGRAVAEGLLAGGVLPVMKHMPGQGRAALDSHLDLPVVTAGRAALAERFRAVPRARRPADGDDRACGLCGGRPGGAGDPVGGGGAADPRARSASTAC